MSDSIPLWDWKFAPCYTFEEMLDEGVFSGGYVRAIPGIKPKYLKHKNVLTERDIFNVRLNKFKVESRLTLGEWKKNGWIKTDKLGWFHWFYEYTVNGRRLGDEDSYQIGRWSSFVSRHQGAINANCKLKDNSCRPKQRQGLLHWAWDSSKERSLSLHKSNVERMADIHKCKLDKGWEDKVDKLYERITTESIKPFSSTNW